MIRAVTRSPFRSYREVDRLAAAQEMIDSRRAQLATLKRVQAHATRPDVQRRLALAILATSNNLKSWIRYAESPHVETRATVIPERIATNG